MIEWEIAKWIEWYPSEGDEGYDGVHDGGIKGAKENAPFEIKKEIDEMKRNIESGIRY